MIDDAQGADPIPVTFIGEQIPREPYPYKLFARDYHQLTENQGMTPDQAMRDILRQVPQADRRCVYNKVTAILRQEKEAETH